jgi:hypothetical protein
LERIVLDGEAVGLIGGKFAVLLHRSEWQFERDILSSAIAARDGQLVEIGFDDEFLLCKKRGEGEGLDARPFDGL